MSTPDAEHVRRAAATCAAFLSELDGADWTVGVPDLDMSVAGVVAHAAEGCLWYAIDLAARGDDLEPVEPRVEPASEPRALITTMRACAELTAAVVDAAPDGARGHHPMGAADPSGFAAMACDELLIHTDDAGRGLGVEFVPPADLAEAVLRRLFPWVAPVDRPWQQLRWANGRTELDGRPRLSDWAWHCAPLAAWDGSMPTRATRR